MTLRTLHFGMAFLLLAAGLSGCGGGSEPLPVSQISTSFFPVRDAFRALVAAGMTKTFKVSGNCSGTVTDTRAPVSTATTATTFDNKEAWPAVRTLTFSYTNCTPASSTTIETHYVNRAYESLGFNSVGVNYGVNAAMDIPVWVNVGDTDIWGTVNLYTDSTKTVPNGKLVGTYVIEKDTPTTAIVKLMWISYNAAGAVTATEHDRYRIAEKQGLVTPPVALVSVDIFDAGNHLVSTYNDPK